MLNYLTSPKYLSENYVKHFLKILELSNLKITFQNEKQIILTNEEKTPSIVLIIKKNKPKIIINCKNHSNKSIIFYFLKFKSRNLIEKMFNDIKYRGT